MHWEFPPAEVQPSSTPAPRLLGTYKQSARGAIYNSHGNDADRIVLQGVRARISREVARCLDGDREARRWSCDPATVRPRGTNACSTNNCHRTDW